MKPKTSIKVLFQRLNNSSDKRFTCVKLWFMHLEDNFNGSYFTKDVVEKAIPSLSNIPILGFIRDTGDGSQDFTGHEEELVVKDGDTEIIYRGSAYGVIPETNNAKFEKRLCDDGIEREFLTVEGVMWNKFASAKDILVGNGIRPHSMEIAENYSGSFRSDGFYEFSNFQFEGACILGVDIEPAMINSTIEVQTAFTKSITAQVSDLLNQYNKVTNTPNSGDKGKPPLEDKVVASRFDSVISELKSVSSVMSPKEDNIASIINSIEEFLLSITNNGGNKS